MLFLVFCECYNLQSWHARVNKRVLGLSLNNRIREWLWLANSHAKIWQVIHCFHTIPGATISLTTIGKSMGNCLLLFENNIACFCSMFLVVLLRQKSIKKGQQL